MNINLTIFSNFRINDAERLDDMKNSLVSFSKIEAKWVINIRGKYKNEARLLINELLQNKCKISHVESKKGWRKDSILFLNQINTEYILYWIEDHICQVSVNKINSIVNEMLDNKIDYLNYTWFFPDLIESWYAKISKIGLNNFFYFDLNNLNHNKIDLSLRDLYLISLPSIFSKKLFVRILKSRRPFLRRWPKETPFDFEKKYTDKYILPFRIAIPKFELFACIDDDNGVNGYSLCSRGLYNKNIIQHRAKKKSKYVIIDHIKYYLKRLTFHI